MELSVFLSIAETKFDPRIDPKDYRKLYNDCEGQGIRDEAEALRVCKGYQLGLQKGGVNGLTSGRATTQVVIAEVSRR